jgi:hypothetical protein
MTPLSPLGALQALSPLDREMLGEMAATLGRAGEKVEGALSRVEELGREADALAVAARAGSADASSVRQKLEAFNAAIDRAETCIWELVVLREALGIRRHETIPRVYPVPRRRRVV